MKIYLSDTTENVVKTTASLVKSLIDNKQKCIVFSEDKITLSLELEIAKILKDSDLLEPELNDLIKNVIDIIEKECDSSIITLVDYEINRMTSHI